MDPDEPGLGSIDGPDPVDTLEPVDARVATTTMRCSHRPESPADGGDRAVVQRLSLSDLPGAGLVRGGVDAVGDLPGRRSREKGKIASLTGTLRSG